MFDPDNVWASSLLIKYDFNIDKSNLFKKDVKSLYENDEY